MKRISMTQLVLEIQGQSTSSQWCSTAARAYQGASCRGIIYRTSGLAKWTYKENLQWQLCLVKGVGTDVCVRGAPRKNVVRKTKTGYVLSYDWWKQPDVAGFCGCRSWINAICWTTTGSIEEQCNDTSSAQMYSNEDFLIRKVLLKECAKLIGVRVWRNCS